MAITLANSTRSLACDAETGALNTGTTNAGGKLRIRAGSTTLVDIVLNSTAFAAAANGVASANGFPKNANAVASGTADNYQALDRDDTLRWSGTVGQGTGDLSLNNTNIASGQNVSVASWTHTVPAS